MNIFLYDQNCFWAVSFSALAFELANSPRILDDVAFNVLAPTLLEIPISYLGQFLILALLAGALLDYLKT
jgi:hypothetical protein